MMTRKTFVLVVAAVVLSLGARTAQLSETGDLHLPEKVTADTSCRSEDPLQPSGLPGPARLRTRAACDGNGVSGKGRRELFNGRDLTGWYTYLKGRGRNIDPKGVFSVTNGVLHITGEEWGSLVTNEEFSDYRLTVEYRWLGTSFDGKREAAPDSGILFHSVGPDGGFAGIWMASHELNLIRGATGDFWTVYPKGADMFLCAEAAATDKPEVRYSRAKNGSRRVRHLTFPVWCAGGREVRLTGNARICRCDIARDWTDTPETALAVNENPMGAWNTATLECRGARARAFFNGKLVNEATRVRPTRGRIQLQSEGCGVEFRRVTLEPL